MNCGPRQRFVVLGATGEFIVHNCTQALARDVQRSAIINAEQGDYPIVLHVYDEDVAEVWPHQTVEGLEAHMNAMPPFAQGWPISASGGWRDPRYQKA